MRRVKIVPSLPSREVSWAIVARYEFGKLILRKVINIFATECHILKLKCMKFDFGWGNASDPAGGVYCAPQDPLLGFNGLTSKGRERRKEEREQQGRRERVGEGRGEPNQQFFPPLRALDIFR